MTRETSKWTCARCGRPSGFQGCGEGDLECRRLAAARPAAAPALSPTPAGAIRGARALMAAADLFRAGCGTREEVAAAEEALRECLARLPASDYLDGVEAGASAHLSPPALNLPDLRLPNRSPTHGPDRPSPAVPPGSPGGVP